MNGNVKLREIKGKLIRMMLGNRDTRRRLGLHRTHPYDWPKWKPMASSSRSELGTQEWQVSGRWSWQVANWGRRRPHISSTRRTQIPLILVVFIIDAVVEIVVIAGLENSDTETID